MAMDLDNKSTIMHSTILLFGLLMALFKPTVAQVGVCYGMVANNLPPASQVIDLMNQKGIGTTRIYGPNEPAFQALSGTNKKLLLDVPNPDLQYVAASQANADQWIRNNVVRHGNVNFQYISVGNEVKPSDPYARVLPQAVRNIHNAVVRAGLGGKIKVSTATFSAAVRDSYPPSHGNFQPDYLQYLGPIINFLKDNGSPLFLNVYPYFAYADNPGQISLDYALFRSQSVVVRDGQFEYKNLFDAMVDSVYAALEKVGAGSVGIVVTETGWPTQGGRATNTENAGTYNQNLIRHVRQGTPRRQGRAIQAYIFAMFDENQKPGAEVERHWGLYFPNKQPKYPISFN